MPYLRLQGGRRALICDPAVGDIGAIIVCGRDIASVKSTRQPAAPGSYRQHDYADSLYIGGFLNAPPQEYAGWVGEDFVLNTTGRFVVNASQCQINCAVQVQGGLSAQGDVQAGQISLQNHTHAGVQPERAKRVPRNKAHVRAIDSIFCNIPPRWAVFLLGRHEHAAA